jgi:hypothetical protein
MPSGLIFNFTLGSASEAELYNCSKLPEHSLAIYVTNICFAKMFDKQRICFNP